VRRTDWRRWFVLSCGAVATAVVVVTLLSREVRFLARAAFEEGRILLKRQSLESLVASSTTPPSRRDLFRLVLEAREFAAETLKLDAGQTYTAFSDVGRDTLVLVLSASPRTALEPYLWHYPILGAVAYKGYFKPAAAVRTAQDLESQGYDTYLRPAGAFSTLGWFNDPLLSTALSGDSVQLVATVIHEITHNTLYVRGATSFNESLASFVGYRGAEDFFALRGDSTNVKRVRDVWADELLLADFYERLEGELRSLYERDLREDAMIRERMQVFAAARAWFRSPGRDSLRVYRADRMAARTLNNASLVAARFYRTGLRVFDVVHDRLGQDLARTVREIAVAIAHATDTDPFAVLDRLAADGPMT
jgi:predicted aminopeptidase